MGNCGVAGPKVEILDFGGGPLGNIQALDSVETIKWHEFTGGFSELSEVGMWFDEDRGRVDLKKEAPLPGWRRDGLRHAATS
jgi:hypothetical protein